MLHHTEPHPDFDAIISAPGFALGVRCDAKAVVETCFLNPCPAVPPCSPLAIEAVRQIEAWLADARFVFDLPTRARGTPFQKQVWAAISAIPPGETRTYSALATSIGRRTPRPVGNACGANPLPILVPCHRVVASNGGLGGFARQRGGFLLDIKHWLLQHEARSLR
ncbi:MAG: methylated-DNA--[protein]-cysteine S-methyltransferase [Zoogloeaceae bacterium]|jgi:methylated-DNA-[protein]-cysteine S-methyltransferase|nr:methylated-DNA--[protein]-cysteine S-methyltransferase [Zoogloeaceae bacterium]